MKRLAGLACALMILGVGDAMAQRSQREVDQEDLRRDRADLQARQRDEQWEIKKNGGCGARCAEDRRIEQEDRVRIQNDKRRLRND